MKYIRFIIYGDVVVKDDNIDIKDIKEDIEDCIGLPDSACQLSIDEVKVEEQ